MRRIYLYLLLFLLLLFVAGGLWFYKSQNWSDSPQYLELLPPQAQLNAITLIRANDTLALIRNDARWYEKRTQRQATESSIQTLLDYFQRVEVRFPISGEIPQDVAQNLRDSGLQVQLHTPERVHEFVLGNNAAGELLLACNDKYERQASLVLQYMTLRLPPKRGQNAHSQSVVRAIYKRLC